MRAVQVMVTTKTQDVATHTSLRIERFLKMPQNIGCYSPVFLLGFPWCHSSERGEEQST